MLMPALPSLRLCFVHRTRTLLVILAHHARRVSHPALELKSVRELQLSLARPTRHAAQARMRLRARKKAAASVLHAARRTSN
eukprot:scaffold44585_cov35-Tisochrysis_lutea.AAC.3